MEKVKLQSSDQPVISNSNSVLIIEEDDTSEEDEKYDIKEIQKKSQFERQQMTQEAIRKVRLDRTIAISMQKLQNSDLSSKYESLEALGKGSFGFVIKVREKATGIVRAAKIIDKKKIDNSEQVMKEIQVLLKVDHPNIVKLIDVCQNDKSIFIIQEYLQGEQLFEQLKNVDHYDEVSCRDLFKQIMDAICFIHLQNISHRDIKPENFVFETPTSNNIKLIDFGLSQCFNQVEDSLIKAGTNYSIQDSSTSSLKQFGQMKTVVGTCWYMAPEVLKKSYTNKCDIWSAGVMLYVMLVGYPPFFGESQDKIKKKIIEGKLKFEDEEWDEISQEAKDLIKHMICPESERYDAQQVLKHTWFQNKTQLSMAQLSQTTLFSLKNFQKSITLKKVLLNIIAHISNIGDQIQKYQKLFIKLSARHNGYMTFTDFKLMLSQYMDEDSIKAIFKSVDQNGDQKIYWNEFIAATISRQIFLREDNLKAAFNYFDKEQKGYIDINDIQQVISKDEPSYTEEIKAMFLEAFPGGKKQIQFEDFQLMMEKIN